MVQIFQKDGRGGEILRMTAKKIDFQKISKEKLEKMIEEMKEAMFSETDGVALAGPQIGLSEQIFVVNPWVYEESKYRGEIKTVFINPEIIKQSRDKKMMEEGCLSVRPFYGKVRRSTRVTIKALDENGKEFEITTTGLLAQIFQHETDHLHGILFTDKTKEIFELK